MPWRRLAALVTIANAQLVVDWTAKNTFQNGAPLKARCALYTTVTFHRTCLPNANQRYYLHTRPHDRARAGLQSKNRPDDVLVIDGRVAHAHTVPGRV